MQCACAIFSSVAFPAVKYFSTFSHKRHDFLDKVAEHKRCVLIFSSTFVWSISHCKTNSTRYNKKCTHIGLHVQYRCSCRSHTKREYYWQTFEKKNRHQISWKSVQWEPSWYMTTDGQKDLTKLRHFSQFCRSAQYKFLKYVCSYSKVILRRPQIGCAATTVLSTDSVSVSPHV